MSTPSNCCLQIEKAEREKQVKKLQDELEQVERKASEFDLELAASQNSEKLLHEEKDKLLLVRNFIFEIIPQSYLNYSIFF